MATPTPTPTGAGVGVEADVMGARIIRATGGAGWRQGVALKLAGRRDGAGEGEGEGGGEDEGEGEGLVVGEGVDGLGGLDTYCHCQVPGLAETGTQGLYRLGLVMVSYLRVEMSINCAQVPSIRQPSATHS